MIGAKSTKASLSLERQRLVEVLQELNFGRIERLRIAKGNPVFDPPPKITKEVKFGGENTPRPESNREDFVLKREHVELFGWFDQLSNGMIESIEVKHGLPFRMTMEGM